MVIAQAKPAQERRTSVRLGWNDAAWGRPRRVVATEVAPSYERGYAGGLIFRKKDRQQISSQDALVVKQRGQAAS